MKKNDEIKIGKAKGRPMLTWVGKKPLTRAVAYPAQHVESFSANSTQDATAETDWSDWPARFKHGGLLFHGDNKDVLAHLLANGLRGRVKLIYIDPPFDSGADYVRRVKLRGINGASKIEGEEYTVGEQLQYTDIWANDNYLQFMFERLLLLKELLAETGTICLHCDDEKVHHLRLLLDEVMGAQNFLNTVIWDYRRWPTPAPEYQKMHDSILLYAKSKGKHVFNRQYMERTESTERRWKGKSILASHEESGTRRPSDYGDSESQGSPLNDVWNIPIIAPSGHERSDYPTQKPLRLIERLLVGSSDETDVVLDAFIGSGTTAIAAQKLSRHWIGCDINKGAIQTTAKRLQNVMREQAETFGKNAQGELVEREDAPPKPAQLSFTTWRVNDYDLQIQHNEAVELACEHIGITRTRGDSFFDGRLGERLVKIIPFNHPLSPLDLEHIDDELKRRPGEERDVTVVCLGLELKARDWVERHNRNRPVNRYHIIELRTDDKYGGFIKHDPLEARMDARREGDKLIVEIEDVLSPTILQRLNMEQGVFRASIEDWRAVVDCIMIDTDYDGEVFNIALSDIPAKKTDLVEGRYEVQAPPEGSKVAVKIIDMLGEELILTAGV